MDTKSHWDTVYRTKRPDEASWFQREPEMSLELIRRAAPDASARIIDVGGGTSSLVDRLLSAGYSNLTVLDVSAAALAQAQTRIGELASHVNWIEADITSATLPAATFDVWHDRAVFHFLTNAGDRAAYIQRVRHAVRPGGHVVVATFAEDGPTQCSGLPVARYSATALHEEFDGGFQLLDSVRDIHITPAGRTQSFVYCLCRFTGDPITRAA